MSLPTGVRRRMPITIRSACSSAAARLQQFRRYVALADAVAHGDLDAVGAEPGLGRV